MRNDWILDVLSDLRSFAAANGMERLADQIDDTALIAATEIAAAAPSAEETRDSGTAGPHGALRRTNA